MKIKELYKQGKRTFSFEFYPPKTPKEDENFFKAVKELKELSPSFISVTYGALGTTRDKTFELVDKVKKDYGIESVAHLTCVAATKDDIKGSLKELNDRGVENILALRGDPPEGETEFKRPANGFAYANELVSFVRENDHDFCIGVAGYPEGHIECSDKEKDLEHLKLKVDAGADYVISQLFFDNSYFFDFLKRARAKGIKVPIIPGILPIASLRQLKKITEICGATVPLGVQKKLEELEHDPSAVQEFGVKLATDQCRELLDSGVQGIHFYTLNRSKAAREIFKNLNLIK
jgi:methylenetetrahydrofolate reductase (NADPH)